MKPISPIIFALVVFAMPAFAQELLPIQKDCAVIDRDAPLPQEATRREKRVRANSRYDDEGWVFGAPPVNDGEGVGRIDEEAPPVPYPVFESSLIALGQVTGSSAFLSNDRQGIYTEFTFQLNEVLKNDALTKVGIGETVVADRAGGCLRFPNGKVTRYGLSDHGLPLAGKTYLLFLKREGSSPNYKILNGYQINGDRPGQHLESFSRIEGYESFTASKLLEAVRAEMANPAYRVLEIHNRKESPIRITGAKTGFGEIVPGVRFAAEYNWLRRLEVTVENESGRSIKYFEVCLCFPRSREQREKADYGYLLEHGKDPSRTDYFASYNPKPMLPGEKVVLRLDDFDYRDVEYELYARGYERGFSRVRLCTTKVVFEDGALWTGVK